MHLNVAKFSFASQSIILICEIYLTDSNSDRYTLFFPENSASYPCKGGVSETWRLVRRLLTFYEDINVEAMGGS